MSDWTRTAQVLRRACFGGPGTQVDTVAAQGLDRWLDAALADAPEPEYPTFSTVPPPGQKATLEEKQAYRQALADQGVTLAQWWVRQLLSSTAPLNERIVFGWHGHWATSISKVRFASAMLDQHRTFRRTGLGSFTAMAKAMVTDPALMVYLDAQQNTKAAPNENLARELMELFTLGVGGGYTETDVKEAARALTGWRLTGNGSAFDPKRHDDGTKTLLGVTGNLDAPAAVDAILAAPAHPKFLATRWWGQLASSEPPPPETLARLTAAYGSGRDLRALFRAILTDPGFGAAVESRVQSPVEWVVGSLRTLKVPVTDNVVKSALVTMRALGQVPLQPPNVSGWPSGQAWLSTASAQTRAAAAQTFSKAANLSGVADAAPASRNDALAHTLGLERFTPRTLSALQQAKGNPVMLTAIGLVSPEYLVV